MQNIFDYYQDPSHGWVKIKKATLTELGIADKITSYSYQNGDDAYLEEDCDLATLLTALSAINVKPVFREHHTNHDSRIRTYQHYHHFVRD